MAVQLIHTCQRQPEHDWPQPLVHGRWMLEAALWGTNRRPESTLQLPLPLTSESFMHQNHPPPCHRTRCSSSNVDHRCA